VLTLTADILRNAPGVKLVMRSLVRARDVPDVIRMAKNAPHGVAYGFTVNVSTRDGQMTSVEVGPGKPEGKVHVYDVSHKGKKPQAPCHYYHFNAYKHLDVSVCVCEGDSSHVSVLVITHVMLIVGVGVWGGFALRSTAPFLLFS